MLGKKISYAIGLVGLLGSFESLSCAEMKAMYICEVELLIRFILTGNSRWVHAMQWSGRKGFNKSATVKFVVDGAEAGSLNSYGPLSFLKVCV